MNTVEYKDGIGKETKKMNKNFLEKKRKEEKKINGNCFDFYGKIFFIRLKKKKKNF